MPVAPSISSDPSAGHSVTLRTYPKPISPYPTATGLARPHVSCSAGCNPHSMASVPSAPTDSHSNQTGPVHTCQVTSPLCQNPSPGPLLSQGKANIFTVTPEALYYLPWDLLSYHPPPHPPAPAPLVSTSEPLHLLTSDSPQPAPHSLQCSPAWAPQSPPMLLILLFCVSFLPN